MLKSPTHRAKHEKRALAENVKPEKRALAENVKPEKRALTRKNTERKSCL